MIQKNTYQPYLIIGIFSSLALLLILTIITLIDPHFFWEHSVVINYPLHSTIETIGAVSAILMAFLSLEIFTEKINPSYVFISLGFLAMGIWDMFHAIVSPGDGFVLTHSLALWCGGLFFFFSIFPGGESILRKKALVFFLTAVFFVSAAGSTILFRDSLPRMIGDGGAFTKTADIINVAAGILFFITAVKLTADYYRHRIPGITVLIFVATLSALAGLTFHYSHAWTDHWWFWHVLRLFAHISLLIYLLVEFFRSMKERSAAILLFEQKNTELKDSNEQLERFAYVASHDLQEPLRKVNSFTQLFERRYHDLVDEKGQKYIFYIKDGTLRMQQLISDLLQFSRINTRGDEFKKIHTAEIVQDIKDLFASQLKETNGRVVVEDLPDIYGDESQIRQLFQNLVGNAIKFRNKGVDPEITIRAEKAGANWVFKVKDNGIGIDEAYKDRIFLIFQRLHSKEAYE
ncbi:MAG: hypothetical protein K9K87_03015, partial [Desulfotignum sp.]|nr:hypothetical protein [Desulfotignum sp.]